MMEWNIQSRAHACQACGREFADKEPYHTVLMEEAVGYTRQDLCEACWSGQASPAAGRPGYVSHWQGAYERPTLQPELIRRETAEGLLRQLLETRDPRHADAVYILAVMLERKRLLKVKDQVRQEGRRVFVYEQPKTGDVFTVADPELSLDQLDQVQRDVSRLLEHGLPQPAEEASAQPPAAVPPAAPDPEPGPVAHPSASP